MRIFLTMKSFFILFVVMLITTVMSGQVRFKSGEGMDLPPNPKSGHCYVRCLDRGSVKQKQTWEDVDCAYIKAQKIDVRLNGSDGGLSEIDQQNLQKELKTFLAKGNIKTLEITSEYGSRAVDSINIKRAIDRAVLVAEYLVSNGMDTDYLKIRAVSTQKSIGFSYRLINSQKSREGE